jgi:hypothetical protein
MNRLKLHPLPPLAAKIHRQLDAPPRLVAHHSLVHNVAAKLVNNLWRRWPSLPFHRETVLLGTALHDIGKTLHPDELVRPGRRHELAGEQLLLRLGAAAEVARFARTHGLPADGLPLEDLVVQLADGIWRGSRNERLEAVVIDCLGRHNGLPQYQNFLVLDAILTDLAEDTAARLAMQAGSLKGRKTLLMG